MAEYTTTGGPVAYTPGTATADAQERAQHTAQAHEHVESTAQEHTTEAAMSAQEAAHAATDARQAGAQAHRDAQAHASSDHEGTQKPHTGTGEHTATHETERAHTATDKPAQGAHMAESTYRPAQATGATQDPPAGERRGPGSAYNAGNLVALTARTPDEALAIRRKGRAAQAAKQRQRRTLKDIYKDLLQRKMPAKATPEAVQEYAEASGRGKLTAYEAIAIAQMLEAAKGSTRAAEYVRDSVGEKPGEAVEVSTITAEDMELLRHVAARLGLDGGR